ncbi:MULTISPECIES: 3-phenylpropionate/cinnamic acid dioxygenase subunit beta [Cycloclasticus]|jgi:3-phenylpropionate/cinnamic acid dioxygenase small subunit|uniref:PAH dioxygenase iron sulfur protein small subunit n=2 Tax=Cycloclasticus TaxID=34067 RepID=S5TGF7_9GAMM|nr:MULTISPECIES: 3-phenylpropionate/cinnamic acid dioxygenase subunit beta [Cycloclasticus]AFT67015.1 PAH dioxygenase iron sulfur protein small subunit [Cycloclasticus sp. P1]AGS39947.1 PAH dioxygenase iron sulfur protein small subunit [Cycloclasticus zancles 78-ME]ATI03381.1 3-phenylpropionate/cinnamic acid dioxygenase subunit beta [Cycloclasticus sp. PY97N]EPD13853.1 PAH dioxygenase iron sulfur protein small subunit [Cycloclasticus pugetii]MBV1899619.1 3-phenylpropionate/cinnamic acid dioxyg|tara:strand:+ start:543 stop:1079 length:537 start_codon:yes stop_codon:yes gene_type:complete
MSNKQQAGQSVDQSTHFEVERFLVQEARALDEERFDDWLGNMLCKDISYQLPTQEVRYRRDNKVLGNSQTTYLYNDDYGMLSMRVARMATGIVWAEDPRVRNRRIISNIDAQWSEADDEIDVRSAFILFRSRMQRDQATHYGIRMDKLRKEKGNWKLASRVITLDQRVVLDKNIHCFF